jgi:hypothetical protein
MNRELVAIATRECRLLRTLISRNKAQHRRAGYFRSLSGASTALTRLDFSQIQTLLTAAAAAVENKRFSRATDSTSHVLAALDAAVVTAAEVAQNLRRASRLLRQQVAAGYFLSLFVALLAVSARLLAILRLATTNLVSLRRSLCGAADPSAPAMLHAALTESLEWLLSYDDEKVVEPLKPCAAIGAPRRDQRGDRAAVSSVEEDDDLDVGESVAFAVSGPPSSQQQQQQQLQEAARSVLPPAAVSLPSTATVLLAADYSDSDGEQESSGCHSQGSAAASVSVSAVKVVKEPAWFLDTSGTNTPASPGAASLEVAANREPKSQKIDGNKEAASSGDRPTSEVVDRKATSPDASLLRGGSKVANQAIQKMVQKRKKLSTLPKKVDPFPDPFSAEKNSLPLKLKDGKGQRPLPPASPKELLASKKKKKKKKGLVAKDFIELPAPGSTRLQPEAPAGGEKNSDDIDEIFGEL